MNNFSRRGLLGMAVFSIFWMKNATLTGLWQVAGAEIPLSEAGALGFLRTAVMCQADAKDMKGSYLNRTDMMLAVVSHKEHAAYEWMSKFRPYAEEFLPGWTLDLSYSKDSFLLIIYGPRRAFAVDNEDWIIYKASVNRQVKATDIKRAADYPGSKPIGEPNDDGTYSSLERIKNFSLRRS